MRASGSARFHDEILAFSPSALHLAPGHCIARARPQSHSWRLPRVSGEASQRKERHMIHRTCSTWMRALPGALALGAVALGAGAAPALADVIVDPNAPSATVVAPAAPTYSYTYTVTTPTTTYTTVAPAAPAETTTTVTYGSAVTAPVA